MDFILDTHILLWGFYNPDLLSKKALIVLDDDSNNFYYSISSMWEIAIKNRSKRRNFPYSAVEFLHMCEQAELIRLSIKDKHVLEYENLPLIHGDPFDNILVAQAIAEGMTLVTHNKALEGYGPNVLVV